MKRRHPIRGFIFGAILGLGVALMMISYAVVPFGLATPYILIGAFAVIGLVLGLLGGKAKPATAPPA